jgi:hypothetical protein
MDVEVRGVLNNTEGEVRGWVETALKIAADFDIDEDDNPAAFVKILELLASKTMVTLQRQPAPIGIPLGGLPGGLQGLR